MKHAFETVLRESDAKVLYRIQWTVPNGNGSITFYRGIETTRTDQGKKIKTVEFGSFEKALKWFSGEA